MDIPNMRPPSFLLAIERGIELHKLGCRAIEVTLDTVSGQGGGSSKAAHAFILFTSLPRFIPSH